MATQTLSGISGMLKQFYIGPIREQLNNSSVLWFRLQKNEEEVSGLDLIARIPIFHKRNQGVGFRAESGTLPTAQRRQHTQTTVGLAYLYGQIQMTGQAIKGSRNQATRFAAVVDNEIRGMIEGMKIEGNRMLWGDGSGALAKISAATGAVGAGVFFTVDSAQQLEAGMLVDTFTAKSGGTQNLASVEIDQVDRRNNKVSFVTAVTVTKDDFIFRNGSRGLYGMGIAGGIDGADSLGARRVSTLQGLARSTNIFWDANVVDNGGVLKALTLADIQTSFELGEIIGQGRCSLIITSYALRAKYLSLMVSDRRFVGSLTLDGGWSALEYSGGGEPVPWVVDYMATPNEVQFIDERTLAIYRAGDIDWMDTDGAVLRKVPNVDAYEGTAYSYINLGFSAPNKNSVLRDRN